MPEREPIRLVRNRQGHLYKADKTIEGYGVCYCGARENSDMSVIECPQKVINAERAAESARAILSTPVLRTRAAQSEWGITDDARLEAAEALAEKARVAADAVDAEAEASKVWYSGVSSEEAWDRAGDWRRQSLADLRTALTRWQKEQP